MMGKVYMIAVGGVGMSALAHLFKEAGYEVDGSDRAVYPPVSDFLRKIGVFVRTPYSAQNVPRDADFVVVGNAVTSENPEVVEVARAGLKTYSLPSALSEFFMKDKISVVVAGTHGKTTTTSMMAHLLHHAGCDPSFFVGGIPLNFNVPAAVGGGEYFVVEGDEYDSAYFDKKAKFYHYMPRYLILTSIEYDHADIYPDLSTLKRAFFDLVGMVPEDGLIVACSDYGEVKNVLSSARCRVLTYSTRFREADIFLEEETSDGKEAKARATWKERSFQIASQIPGKHNLANALSTVICAVSMGIPMEKALAAAKGFLGVRRRQELLGEVGGICLVDDFAHHPTAVRETVEGSRKFYRPERLVAIFEPRSNTSRRNIFERDYAEALSRADLALICPPHNPSAVAEKERFSPGRVCALIGERGGIALAFDDLSQVPPYLAREGKEGDLLLFMSNGDFGGIQMGTYRLLEKRGIISTGEENREENHDR
ncbi:MAG: Mur ligase family protein [Deltaproteobacteria bacterium]|nr:Mur ligase family protein [Deltaproteobacteria bacterium]